MVEEKERERDWGDNDTKGGEKVKRSLIRKLRQVLNLIKVFLSVPENSSFRGEIPKKSLHSREISVPNCFFYIRKRNTPFLILISIGYINLSDSNEDRCHRVD